MNSELYWKVEELRELLEDFYTSEQELEFVGVLEKYFRDKKNKQ